MKPRDYADILGGILLVVLGLAVAWYSNRYEFGELSAMGPGFFPRVLGYLLAGLGVLVVLPALRRPAELPTVQKKSTLFVCLAVLVFALCLSRLGLALTVALTVIVASLADKETTWRARLIYAVAISALTVVIFKFALNMTVPLWWWE